MGKKRVGIKGRNVVRESGGDTLFFLSQPILCRLVMMMGPFRVVLGYPKLIPPVYLSLRVSNQLNQLVEKPDLKILEPNHPLLSIFLNLPLLPPLDLVNHIY